MDLNLITIAHRANLGGRIVASYENAVNQITNIEYQYDKILNAKIFDEKDILFNKKVSFIGAVSLLEQYLYSIHHEILLSFPKKLGKDKFDIDEVEEEGGLLPVIKKKAVKKVLDTAYGSFTKQIEKISQLLELTDILPQDLIDDVNEIKTSRDVYVHSPDAKANIIYVQKTGSKARAHTGSILKLDDEYFRNSIKRIANFLNELVDKIPGKHKKSNRLYVFKQMWDNTCLSKRRSFEQVWDASNGHTPYPVDFENDHGFSHSEMEVYNFFRYIYGAKNEHKPDFAYYFVRWEPSSKESQIAYSWLDSQFYF